MMVGVGEVTDPGVFGQKLAGKGRLASAIGSGDDDAAGSAGQSAIHLSQLILISFSSVLKSGSPVASSAFFSFAGAAEKASAMLILWRALNSAAVSASARFVE